MTEEFERYRTEIRGGRTLVITNQQVTISGRDGGSYSREEITHVEVVPHEFGFFGAPLVKMYVLAFPGYPAPIRGISAPIDIICRSVDQAEEIARKIRPYIRPR